MITSEVHVPRHPATRPPEGVRTLLVEHFRTPLQHSLKPLLEVITLLEATRAKTDLLLLAHPSDQLQLTFVFCAILAFAILIIPVPTEFSVCRPIFLLTIDASRLRRYGRYNHADCRHSPQYALPLHLEHLRNLTSGVVSSLSQVLHRERFVMAKREAGGGMRARCRVKRHELMAL